jgi:hypothetical protein
MKCHTLRDRIAESLAIHADYIANGIRHCTCGEWSGDSQTTRIGFAAHVADAVITECEKEIAKMDAKGICRCGHPRAQHSHTPGHAIGHCFCECEIYRPQLPPSVFSAIRDFESTQQRRHEPTV